MKTALIIILAIGGVLVGIVGIFSNHPRDYFDPYQIGPDPDLEEIRKMKGYDHEEIED